MSTLELEAAVQRDPKNAQVWYALGVKQQDSEREQQAIEALRRAVELDPEYVPSWMALGISHTNDSNRAGAYGAIREWVKRHPGFPQTTALLSGGFVDEVFEPGSERSQKAMYDGLIACLIEIIRNGGGSEEEHRIDPDVQIALAVLLNSNEEYAKATDCFLTALAVRPHVSPPGLLLRGHLLTHTFRCFVHADFMVGSITGRGSCDGQDWALYNRVGATLANSGNAESALAYYYRALELNPVYIRAR
jgi:peroxin-5